MRNTRVFRVHRDAHGVSIEDATIIFERISHDCNWLTETPVIIGPVPAEFRETFRELWEDHTLEEYAAQPAPGDPE